MNYSINDGVVEQHGNKVEPELVFKLGRFTALVGGNNIDFVVSKRPAQIEFVFELSPEPIFTLKFRGQNLNVQQTAALVSCGYFILENSRVCFVSSRVTEHLEVAFGPLSLPKLIKLLRALFQEQGSIVGSSG